MVFCDPCAREMRSNNDDPFEIGDSIPEGLSNVDIVDVLDIVV